MAMVRTTRADFSLALFWAHIGLAGSFGTLLVGGCGARDVSRKTPIYFILFFLQYCDFGGT